MTLYLNTSVWGKQNGQIKMELVSGVSTGHDSGHSFSLPPKLKETHIMLMFSTEGDCADYLFWTHKIFKDVTTVVQHFVHFNGRGGQSKSYYQLNSNML